LEATASIREKEKASGLHQAIIKLTAHAMKGNREKCIAGGMDGYLTQPIRPQAGRNPGRIRVAAAGWGDSDGSRRATQMKSLGNCSA
jgi:CheY-like chemotaxis protein